MLHINVLHCELVEKPKSAEGWMFLFRPKLELNLSFQSSLSRTILGHLKSFLVSGVRGKACIQVSRLTFQLDFVSRKINRKSGRCL